MKGLVGGPLLVGGLEHAMMSYLLNDMLDIYLDSVYIQIKSPCKKKRFPSP